MTRVRNKRKYILSLVAFTGFLLLSACSHNILTEPEPLFLDTHLDQGPPEYREGYYDGCHSALGAYGNTMMKTAWPLRKQAKYADNKLYNQVWKDAWSYCYQWIFVQRLDDSLL